MRKYEIMFIVRPTVSEEEYKEVIKKFTDVLKSNGATIIDEKNIGQKDLAYEIKDFKSGFYYLFNVESKDSKATDEFDRQARISDVIIRHLIKKIEG